MSIDTAQLSHLVLPLLLAGAVSGLAAGLLGVGGGLIMVPVFFHTLSALGYTENAIHSAVATSLAVIVTTSIRSTLAHHKRNAVDTDVLKNWLIWLFTGAIGGSMLAIKLSGQFLTALFGIVTLLLSVLFFRKNRDFKPLRNTLPTGIYSLCIGNLIGALSAVMGIGGGVFGVPMMILCGLPVHRAVGTSAAFGAAIGLPGMIGYIAGGWELSGLPPLSVGYVNIAGWMVMAVGAMLLAPVGARLAHRLEADLLRRIFAVVLLLNGAHMLHKALT